MRAMIVGLIVFVPGIILLIVGFIVKNRTRA